MSASTCEQILPDPPASELYHILSKQQKWALVIFVSLAGCFSPLSSNIYFPALDTISHNLGISASLVSLTITVYMIVQGIAPSLFGAVSDSCGRRLPFTISLAIYTAANFALAFTSNYAMLMVFRALQAAGSAATISISAGVIADVALPEERGGFIGINAGVRMMGQAVGPVIGGLLNSVWGFRSIFWFLFTLSVIVLSALVIFLPETQRSIAGNGSVPLTGTQKPLIYILKPPRAWSETRDTRPAKPHKPINIQNTFSPLAYILEKDIAVLLAWGSIAYTAWSMVTSSITTMLVRGFPFLTQWQIGLCFLPNGLGCIAGSLSTGWLLNHSFQRAAARYKTAHAISNNNNNNNNNTTNNDTLINNAPSNADFPYIKSRLHLMPLFAITLAISLALYGPSFEFNDIHRHSTANLAAPLILQFIIAFTATAIFSINSTVLIDCFPDLPASATALNNLCRCLLGAAGVSVIQPLIAAVKPMVAFLVVTGVVVLCLPLVWVEWMWGEQWRKERQVRLGGL
ncbi:major facilitator superfamily domain-containing protein [Aspergillus crustosus]